MSDCGSSATPSLSPTPPHALAVAQQLPQDVVALIAHHLTVDDSEHRHDTLEDRRDDVRSFARVCKAWRAAGTAAAWREVELFLGMAFWVGKHLETYPHLFKHVESMSVSLSYLSIARADDESQDVVASCPRLSRLELRVDRQAGSYLQALQDKTDLTKLFEVVIQTVDMSWQSWHHYATFDRLVSANLVFAFVRACPNVRRFAYIGHQEIVNETADVPHGRRIKLDELTLDIKDTKLDSETGRRSSSIRSRFLLQFDLGRLVVFKAHVNLRDSDNLAALDRMANLETLRLVDDHGLDVDALDALGARIVRLVKLRDVDLSAAPEVECPTSPAVLQAVERLFKALPATVERLSLSVPLPEPLAEALLEGSPGLEHFLSHVYDPLDVRPEASEMHWRRTVYVSGDEMEQLDVEDNESL